MFLLEIPVWQALLPFFVKEQKWSRDQAGDRGGTCLPGSTLECGWIIPLLFSGRLYPNPELASFYAEAFFLKRETFCKPVPFSKPQVMSSAIHPDWILLPPPFPQHFPGNGTPALGLA